MTALDYHSAMNSYYIKLLIKLQSLYYVHSTLKYILINSRSMSVFICSGTLTHTDKQTLGKTFKNFIYLMYMYEANKFVAKNVSSKLQVLTDPFVEKLAASSHGSVVNTHNVTAYTY